MALNIVQVSSGGYTKTRWSEKKIGQFENIFITEADFI